MRPDLTTDALPATERFDDHSGETRGRMGTRADGHPWHAGEVRSVTTVSLYHMEQSFDGCTTFAPDGMIERYRGKKDAQDSLADKTDFLLSQKRLSLGTDRGCVSMSWLVRIVLGNVQSSPPDPKRH